MTTTNFNVTPYYDDFDEDKNFYRILFQPGRAVQARELTQSQTILQDQVKKFGDHIFKDGSRVTGAEIFSVPEFGRKIENIENSQKPTARSVKLESTFESSSINVSSFVNKYITANTANVQLANVKNIYFVHHADPAVDTDPDTLYVSYLRTTNLTIGGSTSNSTMELQNANTTIQNSANLQVFSTSDVAPANLIATVTTQIAADGSGIYPESPAKLLGVDEGVFFTGGIFAKNQKQIIAVDKYGSNANVSVGFDVVENTITSTSDTSLLDPALDSSNYLAPGGDRLKISLTLTKKDLDSNNSLPSLQTNKYIELVRFRNGQLVKDTSGTRYADLGRTLARRTFDESGDYIVDGLEPRLTPIGNSANFFLNISKGKAYVKGYEIDKTNDITKLAVKRAQDQESVTGYDLPTAYGNFLHIHQSNNAIFNSNTSERILLHSSNTITNTLTQIGEAYVKNIEYVSGDGFDAVHKLHLFGVKRSGANNLPLSMTKSIIGAGLGQANANVELSSITTIQTSGTIVDDNSNHIIVADSSQIRVGDEVFGHNLSAFTGITGEGERRVHVTAINGSNITLSAPNNGSSRKPYSKEIANTYTFQRAAIQDTNDTLSVFPAAYSTVASVNQIDYNTRRIFKTVTFTDGVASIVTDDGSERFKAAGTAALKKELYAIMIRTGTTPSYSANHAVNMANSDVSISTPTPSEGSQATASIDLGDDAFDGTADILATLDVTDAGRRTKTSNSHFKLFTALTNNSTTLHSLGITDVTNVTGVFIASGSDAATTANTNVLDSFVIDTGQRNGFYDHATIKKKASAIGVVNTGKVNVTYTRFAHTGLGHFDANSFPSYTDIPQYIDDKGNKIELRDSIDFRPLRQDDESSNVYSNSAMTFTRNQIVDRRVGSADVDLSYYLSRIDKVVLGFDGQFRIIEGDSALNNPATPLDDPDSMTLYKLTFPPYTFQTSNVDIDIVKNRRYTMKDIGGIDDRLSRVEYYTALNLLESEVAGSTFFSNSNIELINNGFLVDDFKGHSIGDVLNSDYKCSIDYDNQILHPRFTANGTNTSIQSGSLTNTGNVLTLPFTTQVYSAQNVASTSVNINPFNVVSFVGYVKLDTDVTNYADFDSRPIVVSNRDGNSDNYEFGTNFQGSVWSEWDLLSFNNDTTRKYTYYDKNGSKVSTTTSAEEASSQATKTESDRIFYYMSAENIDFEIFGYRPNTEVHAFLDGKNVSDRLRAFNSTTNAFETAPKKCLIISDDNGFAKGRLVIPNNEGTNRQFAAGEHQIFFSDSIASPNVFSTFAETRYYSGTPKSRIIPPVVEVRQDPPAQATPVATECAFQEDDDRKTPNCQSVSGARAELSENGGTSDSDITDATFGISEQIIRDTYSNVLGRKPDKAGMLYYMERIENNEIDAFTPGTLAASLTTIFEASPEAKAKNECPLGQDPLAQTFFVNEFTNPKGIFITSVDIFFASKDSTLPVHFEIRKVLNGYPSETVVAKSRVSRNPDDVIIPSDPNVPEPTRFTFDAPLFLEPDQYSMVLLTSSFEYNVYIATVGQNRLDTGQSIVGQPYLGSLFKSQNASTWTAAQESDLCFVIHQAQFNITGDISSIIQPVKNAPLPDQAFDLLRINAPFQTFSDKTSMSFKLGLLTEGQSNMDAGISALPNSDTYLENRKEFKKNADANLQITMSSTNADVSPVFEQDRCRFVFVENLLNSSANTEVVARPETGASDGGASSKYITRKVTLGEGFDATALRVILAKNLPEGSSISVFYKVQSDSDETTAFEDLPYVEMNKITQTPVNQNINEYYDCEFKAEDITYSSAGISFDSFRSFAIKIVFFSTNTAKAPTARNLRVIALS
ncbi:MAG: DUF4815 domain-containing protein [Candidatus Pelagibacter sp. TMED165]|nr:MAG: DUF4815 domain-containing protein [Candidatus Pelagibacter sp. TMED165]